MFVLGPADNPVNDSKSDAVDGRFGGNRTVGGHTSSQDYTKNSGLTPDSKENPVEDVTRDVDDLAENREFTIRKETSDLSSRKDLVYEGSSPENLPKEDTDATFGDAVDHRRAVYKGHIGEGQVDY